MSLEPFAAAAILIWINMSYLSKFLDQNIAKWVLYAGTIAVGLSSIMGLLDMDSFRLAEIMFLIEGLTIGFSLLANWIFKGKKIIEKGLEW